MSGEVVQPIKPSAGSAAAEIVSGLEQLILVLKDVVGKQDLKG